MKNYTDTHNNCKPLIIKKNQLNHNIFEAGVRFSTNFATPPKIAPTPRLRLHSSAFKPSSGARVRPVELQWDSCCAVASETRTV